MKLERFSFGTGGTKLEYNTVYCLRETKAPDGYVLDSTPRYYVIAKAQDEVYPEELEQWRQHGAEIYYSGSTYKVTIYNQRGTLMLNKKFQDVNGNEITGTSTPEQTLIIEYLPMNGSTRVLYTLAEKGFWSL